MDFAAVLRYLTYPLRGGSLVLIVIFSLLLTLAGAGGLLGLPLTLIVLACFFSYGFVLLDHAADGAIEPPVFAIEMMNPANEPRPVAFLIIAGAFYALTEWWARSIGEGTVETLRIIGLLVLPATLMVQGATGSVLRSLDPRAIGVLIFKVGGSYALVLGIIAVLYVLVRGLLALVPDPGLPHSLPLHLDEILGLSLLMYLWLACFALAGGVLYEHRDELGLEPSHSPEREEEKREREHRHELDHVIDSIFAEWRGGSFLNAWAQVEKRIQASPDPMGAMLELYERAATWSDLRLAHRLAQDLLPKLLLARRNGEALDVIRACVRQDPQFRPMHAAETLRLAELARDAGDRPTARALLREFASRYPQDSSVVAAENLARQLER
jgi:hypothetical protein